MELIKIRTSKRLNQSTGYYIDEEFDVTDYNLHDENNSSTTHRRNLYGEKDPTTSNKISNNKKENCHDQYCYNS